MLSCPTRPRHLGWPLPAFDAALFAVLTPYHVLTELASAMHEVDVAVSLRAKQLDERLVERPLVYGVKKGGDGVVDK